MPPLLLSVLMLASASDGGENAAPIARLVALAPDTLDFSTFDEQAALASRIRLRIAELQHAGKLNPIISAETANLAWPLAPASGFTPFGYYGIGYFVDHDPRYPGMAEDYTCGTRSYDLDTGYNHGGTDFYLWPYPWLMMDSDDIQIIAAAPGVIVEKIDGNFDRDCAIQGTSGFNAVFVRQDDGLTAWYLHMKNGSLTTQGVGDRVAAGDFLGLVGSSGPSSLPHLHFELRDGADAVVDPYHGACNAAPDRWIAFQPYESPRIDALTTHSAEPDFVDCGVENGAPVHEEPHFQDRFLPGDTLWVFAAYSDQRNGQITHFTLSRPDGSAMAQWDFDLASQNLPRPFYSGAGWAWGFVLPGDTPVGRWHVLAQYEGHDYEHAFDVVPATGSARGHSTHVRAAPSPTR